MSGVRLSNRMAAIAALVTPGSRLADIGCDHAFLPIALCQTGRIPSAIAMDIKEGPLAIARAHIASCGWDDRIETRRSDGLKELGDDEADAVIIAGMGGVQMQRILTECAVPPGVKELILQPQSEVPGVRRCVREIGFHIAEEDMVLEDGKFYPMMKALRGRESAPEGLAGEMADAFGPVLLRKRHPVLFLWLEREYGITENILARLEQEIAGTADAGRLILRRDEMEHQRKLLRAAMECDWPMTDPDSERR